MPPDMKAAIQEKTPELLKSLFALARQKADPRVQAVAIKELLDRGWGRAAQTINAKVEGVDANIEHHECETLALRRQRGRHSNHALGQRPGHLRRRPCRSVGRGPHAAGLLLRSDGGQRLVTSAPDLSYHRSRCGVGLAHLCGPGCTGLAERAGWGTELDAAGLGCSEGGRYALTD